MSNESTIFLNGLKRACTFEIDDIKLQLLDFLTSRSPEWICADLQKDPLGLRSMDLKPGSIVLDIGANIGVVSCYLAKKYTGVTIIAVEPMPHNYNNLVLNIEANALKGRVVPFQAALTGDGRDVVMQQNPIASGIATLDGINPDQPRIPFPMKSYTLKDLMRTLGMERVALMKMDIEGAEGEVLRAFPEISEHVDALALELHEATTPDPKGLRSWLEERLPGDRLKIEVTT